MADGVKDEIIPIESYIAEGDDDEDEMTSSTKVTVDDEGPRACRRIFGQVPLSRLMVPPTPVPLRRS